MPNRLLTALGIAAFALVFAIGAASCGSVASRAVATDAGSAGGSGSGKGGAGGASVTDGGAGGTTGTPTGSGGATGAGGALNDGGSAMGGAGGRFSVDGGIVFRGGVTPLGPSSASGAVRVRRQRLGAPTVCNGSVCASGGLIP
jgi:hypothetical protein